MGAVEGRRDAVVEGIRVPREPSTRSEARGYPLERPAPVGPGRQMEERPERAVDELDGLVELEVAHVAETQVELDARLRGVRTCLLEHRRRGVDPDDGPTRRPGDRDRHPPVPDRELHERA